MTMTSEREQLMAGAPVTERRIDLAGFSTVVLEAGDGPPIVLLHGPTAYAAAWLPVIPALAAGHRVIAPDLPGHGATDAGDTPLDTDRVLAWLAELINDTCPTPPVLVGQMIGGAMAARYAAGSPDSVRKLMLAVPFGLAPFAPPTAFSTALAGYFTDPTGSSHDALWEQCVHDVDDVRGRLGLRWNAMRAYNLAQARTPAVGAGWQTMLQLFASPVIPEAVLSKITAPTTLIWGRDDLIVPASVGETAGRRYGWPVRLLDNTGNEPAIEAPDAFVQVVTS